MALLFMRYFYVEPEVAGGLGENTVMDTRIHPPLVTKLHYEMDGWLGDVLLESFPCFIVTISAMRRLQEAQLSGAGFDDVEVTRSSQFDDIYPGREIPGFAWLKPVGVAGSDDFGASPDGVLVVSERALGLLQGLGIPNALVKAF